MKFIENLRAFCFEDDKRELFRHCEAFASHIKSRGIKELEIYLNDAFCFYAAFFGSLMAGAVPTVLQKPIFDPQKIHVRDENFTDFLNFDEDIAPELDENAKFFLQTSGSSAKSKIIEKSLDEMIKESLYLAEELKFSPGEVFFSSVSHQHMFGLTFKVFLPLVLGAKVIAKELNYPEIILDVDLKDHIFITSPVLLQTLVQSPRAANLKLLKGIVCAGSALKNELRDELTRLCDARTIEIYGSTETGVVARNLGDGLKIFSKVDAGLDEREALNVRSPWCKFFQTNDWARIDGDRLILKGRMDRIIKLNDKRVSLESVESRLLESGIVKDCYCGMHPNFKRVAALLVLNEKGLAKFRRNGKKGVVSELTTLLRSEFKNNIRYFRIVSDLGRNKQGKFEKSRFKGLLFDDVSLKWSDEGSDGQKYKFSAVMDAGLKIFTDHFPNLPLLPGFMQLDFVFHLASVAGLNLNGASRIENLKFTKFVRPNDRLSVWFEKKNEKLYFEIFCNGERCSLGRISCE